MACVVELNGERALPRPIRRSLLAFGSGDPVGSSEPFARDAVLRSSIHRNLRSLIPEVPVSGKLESVGHLEIAKIFAIELAYFDIRSYRLRSVIRVDHEVATLMTWVGAHRPSGALIRGRSEIFWRMDPVTSKIQQAHKSCVREMRRPLPTDA